MIEERATVVSVNDDRILVEAAVKSTCTACSAKSDCGTGAVARAFSNRTQQLALSSPMPVNVGDTVVIGIQENGVVLASWLLYLLPMGVFLCALLSLSAFWDKQLHELLIFAFSIVPTALCFRYVAKYIQRLDKGRFQPVIIRRVLS